MIISKSRILSIALVISLAVNVIIGGFLAAQWIDHGWGKKRPGGYFFDRRAAAETLGKEQKEKLEKIWEEQRDVMRPYFRKFGDARRKLAELLTAETLDLTAINAAYADIAAAQAEIQNLLQASLLEIAKSLPAEERAAFFKEGFRPPRKHFRPDEEKKE